MELTIKDRIVLRELLPEQGDLIQMMLAKSIISKIDFSPQEIAEKSITSSPDGQITWDVAMDVPVDIQFETTELVLLKFRVDEFDKTSKITQRILDVCLKIKES